MTDVRRFKNRRSATDLLRKRGVAPADYAALITEDGGEFVIDLSTEGAIAPVVEKAGYQPKADSPAAQAMDRLQGDEKPKAAKKAAVKATKKTAVKKATVKQAATKPAKKAAKPDVAPVKATTVRRRADGKLSVSQFCLNMFKAGATNAEVWAKLQTEYGLDEEKAHYPSWYRSHFKRKGDLS